MPDRHAEALERLIEQSENDPSLLDPNRLRQRLETLDRLDAYIPDAHIPDTSVGSESELYRRATALHARLEAVNSALYQAIRNGIQCGATSDSLLRWVNSSQQNTNGIADLREPATGMGYDYLDELVSGILQLQEPNDTNTRRESEMVFYQPTPARHIFNMIAHAALTEADVLVDLGSGLGHVPILVSICTRARSIGIELETAYIERARQCAQSLNLSRVEFICQDARTADLSSGTLFYLYTPFTGSILSNVLNRLKHEAATRRIRICTYGPCTSAVAEETWLAPTAPAEADRITIFHSRN